MKRKSLFLISTLMAVTGSLGALPQGSAQAFSKDEPHFYTRSDGSRLQYWTYDELLEFSQQVKAEREAACGPDDGRCQRDYTMDLAEEDSKYFALEAFENHDFLITNFDIPNNKVKVKFVSEDMHMWYMTGRHRIRELRELYLIWFRPGANIYGFMERLKEGLVDNGEYHKIYADPEADWITPDVEVELDAPDANLGANTYGNAQYGYYTMTGESYSGTVEYNMCLDSPEYREGMQCRIGFDETSNRMYYPYDPAWDEPEDEPAPVTPDTPADPTEPVDPTELIDPTEPADPANPTAGQTDPAGVADETATGDSANINTAATPDTGEVTAENHHSVELPWWLAAIFASGIAFLVWFFLPNKKKSKNN